MGKNALKVLVLDADALKLSGPDAFAFSQGMFTADLRRGMRDRELAAPYGGGSFLLDQKAKIVAPSKYWVFKTDELILSLPRGQASAVAAELEKFHVADDLEILTFEKSPWDRQLMVQTSGDSVFPTMEIPGPGEGALDRVYKLGVFPWGFSLPMPEWGSDFFQLWIQDPAAFEKSFDVQKSSAADFESLRIERGVPKWSVDFDRESFVLEYPHRFEISFFKGCYKGQEVVARGTYRGTLPKGFARFIAPVGKKLEPGFVYNTEDPLKPVGKITSAAGNAGLGLIRVSSLQSGKLFQGEESTARTEISRCDVLIQGRE